MALNAQRPPDHIPVDHNQVAVDIEALHHASKHHEEVCSFFNYHIIIILVISDMVSGSIFRNLN